MKLLFKIIVLGIVLFLVACNSKNEELERVKIENEKLKNELIKKELIEHEEEKTAIELAKQKDSLEAIERENAHLEIQKKEKEVDQLKSELQKKAKAEAENNRLKKISINIIVDPLKKDGRKWDMTGGPDIIGEIVFSDTTIQVNSEKNNSVLNQKLSNIKIKIGDKVRIKLFDRDMSQHDIICDDNITYSGEKKTNKIIGSANVTIEVE